MLHTVPVIATVISSTCPRYARVKRVFDSESVDLAAAWDVMKRTGLPSQEVEDLEDVRRLLHEWLTAAESGTVAVDRQFLVIKVGALVVGLLYFQNFRAWQIVYVSYWAIDQSDGSLGLARDALRSALIARTNAIEGLRAVVTETGDLLRYRALRMMLTSGDARRRFTIVGLPNYRQPPISLEESSIVVPVFLVCCWMKAMDTHLTREEAIDLVQFMYHNYEEAFRHLHGSDAYLKSLDTWHEEVLRDIEGTVPLWTSEQDIPAETLGRLTRAAADAASRRG